MLKVLCLLWLISICPTGGDVFISTPHHRYRHATSNRFTRSPYDDNHGPTSSNSWHHRRKEVAYYKNNPVPPLVRVNPFQSSYLNTYATTVRPQAKNPEEYFRQKTSSETYYNSDEDDYENYDDADIQEDAPTDDDQLSAVVNGVDGETIDDDDVDDEKNGPSPVEEESSSKQTFTDYKWQHYGTRGRVEESRRHFINGHDKNSLTSADTKAAAEHAQRIYSTSRCLVPSPRVVLIQSEYPDTAKTYFPHCTVLHRCGTDTGCCTDRNDHCTAKNQTQIPLYFYVTSVNKHVRPTAEKLLFFNHTECACLPRNSSASSTKSLATAVRSGFLTDRNLRNSRQLIGPTLPPAERCKCPKEFSAVFRPNGRCICDCVDKNKDCIGIKRGHEHFSYNDRVCIQNNQCGFPSCEYGTYNHMIGRCPRREEKIEAFRQHRRPLY